jgi:hypothetical protein
VRPFTKVTLIVLFLLILAAAVYQLAIAGRDQPAYPGPVPGTPYPTAPSS